MILFRSILYAFTMLQSTLLGAQIARPEPIVIHDNPKNELVPKSHYIVFEDTSNVIDFDSLRFAPLRKHEMTNVQDISATYWVFFSIVKTDFVKKNRLFVEFIDPHINRIELASEDDGQITQVGNAMGSDIPFDRKLFKFKNYLFPVEFGSKDTLHLIARIYSGTRTSFLFKIRSERDFISQAKNEYYGLGVFYGAVLITIITNLIIFLFVRERIYLFYSLYLISCTLIFLSEDMLGFEYLWPSLPALNKLIADYSPIFLVLSFYFYSRGFIQLKNYYPKAHRYVKWIMAMCVSYLLFCTWTNLESPDYRFYIIPFLIVYTLGVLIARKGAKAARYFVLAHSFIILGIVFLILRKLGISFLANPLTFFSLHIGFAIELAVLSYALGEQLSHNKTLKIKAQEKVLSQLKNRQRTQQELVFQLQENQILKDKLNAELELEVKKRASEIVEANIKLKKQAEQINQMNRLLDLDNWSLKKDIRKITEERVLAKEVGFEEFSKLYPDHLACLRFLAEKKWEDGYKCKKCGHNHYCDGKTLLSRRCTRCRYEESPTAFTLLHKCKIPLDKAFYAIFLIYNRKGEISSVDLAEILKLRQSTCWSFLQKAKTAMKLHKKKPGTGWDAIILDHGTQAAIPETPTVS
jgi:two-component system, sensor histidine kinase LadS